MSFIECPQCSHYDSITAVMCPACGADRAELIGELNSIDQEWERDRKPYLVRSKHGQELIPTKGAAVMVVVVTSAVAIAFSSFPATSVPLPSAASPINGMMFTGLLIVIGLGTGVWYYRKAQAYEEAHAAYLRRRSAIQAKYDQQAGCLT